MHSPYVPRVTMADEATARPLRVALVTGAAVGVLALSSVLAGVSSEVGAYGLEKGRLSKCRGDVPCVSTTSVGNPSKFGAPWSYQPQTDIADEAWAALKSALLNTKETGLIMESRDGPDYYLRAEFPSSWRGIDDVEFRLVQGEALVSYRSASREALFIYPLQTPVDWGKNRKRLDEIRTALGWEEFNGNELYDDNFK